jgi:ribonuclease Z
VFRRSKKLKQELVGLERQEILDRKSRGEAIEDHFDEPIIAFTGDTKIEFLDGPDFVSKAKILVMEVTYIDEKKSVSSAREWGHIHFDELVDRIPGLQNEKIVLMHLSARYSCGQFRKLLSQRLSEQDAARVVVFPRDGEFDD